MSGNEERIELYICETCKEKDLPERFCEYCYDLYRKKICKRCHNPEDFVSIATYKPEDFNGANDIEWE